MSAMDYDPDGRLTKERVAIVGVGGTGSHIFDYISKTPVWKIDLFDADPFLLENAKRSPGPFPDFSSEPPKGKLHAERYKQTHADLTGCPEYIDEGNVRELGKYTTVFLCIDSGGIKRQILDVCMQHGVKLIHVGMGVLREDQTRQLSGILTVTACLPDAHGHAGKCIDLDDPPPPDQNHQTIELNALNAALAVIKWKQVLGIYADASRMLDCSYSIARHALDQRFPEP